MAGCSAAEEEGVVGAPAQVVAAVDAERLAGDEGGLGPDEVADGRRHVLDRADPAERHLGQVVVEQRAAGGDEAISSSSMMPGATALTRMPSGPSSSAAVSARKQMPALATP